MHFWSWNATIEKNIFLFARLFTFLYFFQNAMPPESYPTLPHIWIQKFQFFIEKLSHWNDIWIISQFHNGKKTTINEAAVFVAWYGRLMRYRQMNVYQKNLVLKPSFVKERKQFIRMATFFCHTWNFGMAVKGSTRNSLFTVRV